MSTTARSGLKHATQRQAIEAALGNEQVTRQRVERLERRGTEHARWLLDLSHQLASTRAGIYDRSLWGRLRWLLTGK